MAQTPRRRWIIVLLILILGALALLLLRCSRSSEPPPVASEPDAHAAPPAEALAAGEPAAPVEEVLTEATVQAPAEVEAGAPLAVEWTGPANPGDFLAIVRAGTPDGTVEIHYRETRHGNPLELVAPIEPGEYELRYMTFRSRAVLARAPLNVIPTGATLAAPPEVVAGAELTVEWTGPNHAGDYITMVRAGAPDGQYQNFAYTEKGSPVQVTALVDAGPAELRYMTGQGAKVLARRPIEVLTAPVTLDADAEVIAGAPLAVTWTGPSNTGDYITMVPATLPDGQYRNYTDTRKGSPLTVTALIDPGPAELRYMTAQGSRVLARRAVQVRAAEISLAAPAEVVAAGAIEVRWTGPNHPGDYITVVPAGTPDGRYENYADTRRGSPLTVRAPKDPGAAELRYMSGQGARVLARHPIRIVEP